MGAQRMVFAGRRAEHGFGRRRGLEGRQDLAGGV